MNRNQIISAILPRATLALGTFLSSGVPQNIEVGRIARVCFVLAHTGLSMEAQFLSHALKHLIIHQQSDGGWIDTEEAIWCLAFFREFGLNNKEFLNKGVQWLDAQRNSDGGWGRFNRDISRIPITGLLLHLIPELSDSRAVSWLKNEWKRDLQSDTKLTYKGGFFLLGLSASKVSANDCPLIEETYVYLFEEQNNDGGFGPWKDHPIGSDPWSTGIVLLGLLSYPELVKREVIEKTVNWLAETQLPNGLWPCHYIEEGSAYAYWGLVEALKYLSKEIV